MHPTFVPACLALALVMGTPQAAQVPAAATLCARGFPTASPNGNGKLRSGPVVVTGRWASAATSSFHHAISGLAGPVRLTLETCGSAAGGESIAVYRAAASGAPMLKTRPILVATTVPGGDVRTARSAIAPSSSISLTGTLWLAVEIANPSGKFSEGSYRLTISR
jgi:hypothetical protein